MKGTVLVVDDEQEMCDLLCEFLSAEDYATSAARSGDEALDRLRREPQDVVLTDLKMPGIDGLELLARVHALDPDLPVVIVTAFGTIDRAIEATREGAFHFITKPFKLREVLHVVERAVATRRLTAENQRLRGEVDRRYRFSNLIGRSAQMREVFRLIEQVAASSSNVLVLGESGTGKELVAKAIHYNSGGGGSGGSAGGRAGGTSGAAGGGARSDGPFVPVNCSAIPDGLLESELFGHVRGAFTGAVQNRKGLFLEAAGGTLFLDEIGSLGLGLQAKLLRVLQDREVRPVGATRSFHVDIRIIAATNADLREAVAEGRFREDLFYRLSVIPIQLPPLRDRPEDIPLLAQHFLERAAEAQGRPRPRIDPRAMDVLCRHRWSGNVRELENVIERMVVLGRGEVIGLDDLPEDVRAGGRTARFLPEGELPTLRELEADYIDSVLRHTRGNKDRAARILGINRRTLYRMQERSGTRTGTVRSGEGADDPPGKPPKGRRGAA